MKVPNDIKFISRHADVMYVISTARVFHTRLYFLECRDSPRVFNFHFPFGSSGETDFLLST